MRVCPASSCRYRVSNHSAPILQPVFEEESPTQKEPSVGMDGLICWVWLYSPASMIEPSHPVTESLFPDSRVQSATTPSTEVT